MSPTLGGRSSALGAGERPLMVQALAPEGRPRPSPPMSSGADCVYLHIPRGARTVYGRPDTGHVAEFFWTSAKQVPGTHPTRAPLPSPRGRHGGGTPGWGVWWFRPTPVTA